MIIDNNTTIKPYVMQIIKILGSYGNYIPAFIIVYSILRRDTILTSYVKKTRMPQFSYFIFVTVISVIINILLKNLIKEPRPENKAHYGVGYTYGMPSAHAQLSTLFTLIILFMNIPVYIKISVTLLSIIVFIQRYIFKFHTAKQILCGSIVGGTIYSLMI